MAPLDLTAFSVRLPLTVTVGRGSYDGRARVTEAGLSFAADPLGAPERGWFSRLQNESYIVDCKQFFWQEFGQIVYTIVSLEHYKSA